MVRVTVTDGVLSVENINDEKAGTIVSGPVVVIAQSRREPALRWIRLKPGERAELHAEQVVIDEVEK